MYKRILVGFDGSQSAETACSHAFSLAKFSGAHVTVLWVRDSLPHFPESIDEIAVEEESALEFFRSLEMRIRRLHEPEDGMVDVRRANGHPAEKIVAVANAGDYDLIVLGNRGHHGFFGRLLGCTADKVSDHSSCDVLIVKGPGNPVHGIIK